MRPDSAIKNMNFRDIIGQEEIKRKLIESVDSGRIAHAQLFEGAAGFGSLALALAYAKYVNCKDRHDGEVCDLCDSCYKFNQLQHPDLHFIFPVNKSKYVERYYSGDKVISDSLIGKWRELCRESDPNFYFSEKEWYDKIEIGGEKKSVQGIISRYEADVLIEKLSYKATENGYKIVLIFLPERMNSEAANALLKEFEEPSDRTLFLFVSENSSQMLKTILSRTQKTVIPPIRPEAITRYLMEKGQSSESSETIARLSGGNLIDALNMCYRKTDNAIFGLFADLMRHSYSGNYLKSIEWAENYAKLNKEQQKRFFVESVHILRASYMRNMGLDNLAFVFGEESEFVDKFYPFITSANIEKLIREFETAHNQISQNGNPRIISTHFALSLSKLIRK